MACPYQFTGFAPENAVFRGEPQKALVEEVVGAVKDSLPARENIFKDVWENPAERWGEICNG